MNTARSCCCVASPCSCGAGTGGDAFVPITGTQFIYEISFPGSTGKVQLSSSVSGSQIRLGSLPNNQDPNSGPTGGVFCDALCNGGSSSLPCTFIEETCVENWFGGACNVPGETPIWISGGNAYIEDIDIEYTNTSCGIELDQYSSVFLAFYLMPWQNACPTSYFYYCSENQCQQGGATQCVPVVYDDQDSTIPTFIGVGACCTPWQIYAATTEPGLQVGDPYSTAGTIRFTWDGTNLATGRFVGSLTSSTNGPTGSPTINAANSHYRHRGRSSSACANSAGGSTNVCTSRPLMQGVSGDGQGACIADDCCCETEIAIQFTVWQTYYTRGFVSRSVIGNVTGPHNIGNTIIAYYRGCHDPRLYSSSTIGLQSRNMKLDRATVGLSTIPQGLIVGKQWTKYFVGAAVDCLVGDYGGVSNAHSFSIVTDPTLCGCITQVSSGVAFTAERAIEIGVPSEITVTRITP